MSTTTTSVRCSVYVSEDPNRVVAPEVFDLVSFVNEYLDKLEGEGYEILAANEFYWTKLHSENVPVAVVVKSDWGWKSYPIMVYCAVDHRKFMYLSPFRGYRFQVSATISGEMDLGSSPVVGLANILDAHYGSSRKEYLCRSNTSYRNMGKEMLYVLAQSALYAACNYGGGKLGIFSDDRDCMNAFIDATVHFIEVNG